MPKAKQKYILVGGGTGGSVAPLLAIGQSLSDKTDDLEPCFVGSGDLEQRMAKQAGMKFYRISSGKYKRYFALSNLATPFLVFVGFLQSYFLLKTLRPAFVFGTGSFVQVPVMWAAWILGIPVFIHQQDYIPSLANKLCALIAKKITVTFPKSRLDFGESWTLQHGSAGDRIFVTGNPVRRLSKHTKLGSIKKLKLDEKYPTLLVMGGGTGAFAINQLVEKSLPELLKICNVIHLTGKDKNFSYKAARYFQADFYDDMGLLYSAADLVVCRAGLGTLSELAVMQKPAVVVPIPKTHQEYNALYLSSHEGALYLDQDLLTPLNFAHMIRGVFFEHKNMGQMAQNLAKILPSNADLAISKVILHNI